MQRKAYRLKAGNINNLKVITEVNVVHAAVFIAIGNADRVHKKVLTTVPADQVIAVGLRSAASQPGEYADDPSAPESTGGSSNQHPGPCWRPGGWGGGEGHELFR